MENNKSNIRVQVLLNESQKKVMDRRIKKLGMSISHYFKYAMLIESIISGEKNVMNTLGSTFRHDQIIGLNKKLENFFIDYTKTFGDKKVS